MPLVSVATVVTPITDISSVVAKVLLLKATVVTFSIAETKELLLVQLSVVCSKIGKVPKDVRST